MYNASLNLFEGEVEVEEFSCSFFYEVERNGKVKFYLNQNIATQKLIKMEFQLETKKEYELKVQELECVINQFSLSKEGKEFSCYLQNFIEKVEYLTIIKSTKNVTILGEAFDQADVYLCFYEVEDIQFKFQKAGKRKELLLLYPSFKKNEKGELDYYRVWNSENAFEDMFISAYWEEVRKKSKYRLRFLQTINE